MAAGAGGTGPAVDLSKIVSLSAPSMRPDEPVTAGSLPQSTLGGAVAGVDETTLNYLRQVLPTLALAASMPMANAEFRQIVRRLRSLS